MKKNLDFNSNQNWGSKNPSNSLKTVVDNKGSELEVKRIELNEMTDKVFELSTKPLRRMLMSRGQKELAKTVLQGYKEGLEIEMKTQSDLWKVLGEAMVITTKKSLEACVRMSDATRIKISHAHINKEILNHTNDVRVTTNAFLKEISAMREDFENAHEDDKPMIHSLITRIKDNWFARMEILSDRISEVILIELKSVEL